MLGFLEMPFNVMIKFSESTQKRQTRQQPPSPGPDQWHVSPFSFAVILAEHVPLGRAFSFFPFVIPKDH